MHSLPMFLSSVPLLFAKRQRKNVAFQTRILYTGLRCQKKLRQICFGILHKILTQLSCAGESDFLNIPSSTQQFAGMDARKSPIRAWMASRGDCVRSALPCRNILENPFDETDTREFLCNMPFCPSNPTHLSPPSPPAIPYFPPESDSQSPSGTSPPAAAHAPHSSPAP